MTENSSAKPLPQPSQNDVGKRVSIRLFQTPPDERAPKGFRDLLGYLESTTTVRKKDGTIVEFNPDEIFLWKVVESGPRHQQ